MLQSLANATKISVEEIASSMLFKEIKVGTPSQEASSMSVDISALIGMGGGLQGSLRLAAPEKTALVLLETLSGEKFSAINTDVKDGFGEMANMIAGGIQLRIQEFLGKIRISPPLMIVGKGHRTRLDRRSTLVIQELSIDGCSFFLEIQFRPPKE